MNKKRKNRIRKFGINKTNKIMRQRHREKYHHIKGVKTGKNAKKRLPSWKPASPRSTPKCPIPPSAPR